MIEIIIKSLAQFLSSKILHQSIYKLWQNQKTRKRGKKEPVKTPKEKKEEKERRKQRRNTKALYIINS